MPATFGNPYIISYVLKKWLNIVQFTTEEIDGDSIYNQHLGADVIRPEIPGVLPGTDEEDIHVLGGERDSFWPLERRGELKRKGHGVPGALIDLYRSRMV